MWRRFRFSGPKDYRIKVSPMQGAEFDLQSYRPEQNGRATLASELARILYLWAYPAGQRSMWVHHIRNHVVFRLDDICDFLVLLETGFWTRHGVRLSSPSRSSTHTGMGTAVPSQTSRLDRRLVSVALLAPCCGRSRVPESSARRHLSIHSTRSSCPSCPGWVNSAMRGDGDRWRCLSGPGCGDGVASRVKFIRSVLQIHRYV